MVSNTGKIAYAKYWQYRNPGVVEIMRRCKCSTLAGIIHTQ